MTLPHKKRMEVINQKLVDEKKLKRYEVEIQLSTSKYYEVFAKDDADLIQKWKEVDEYEEEWKHLRDEFSEHNMGEFKQIK